MKKLLKECLAKLVKESSDAHVGFSNSIKPFEMIDAPKKLISRGQFPSEHYIEREISFALKPGHAEKIGVKSAETLEDIQKTGFLTGYAELYLDMDVDYSPGTASVTTGRPDTWMQGDPDSFDIGDFKVIGILLYDASMIIMLSDEDARRLAEWVGDFTDEERDAFHQRHIDKGPDSGPDRDDFGYDD